VDKRESSGSVTRQDYDDLFPPEVPDEVGQVANHSGFDPVKYWVGENPRPVQRRYQAGRFEDSDNMPDDPEQNLEEKEYGR